MLGPAVIPAPCSVLHGKDMELIRCGLAAQTQYSAHTVDINVTLRNRRIVLLMQLICDTASIFAIC